MKPDQELRDLIHRWSPPQQTAGLDSRMLARYRRSQGWRAHWKRFRNARLSVPLPWAAGFAIAAGLLLLYLRSVDNPRDRLAGFEPVATPRMTVVRAEVLQ